MAKVTKSDLVDIVARKAHLTKKAANEAIDVFLDQIGRSLSKGDRVVLFGFGTFRKKRMQGKTVKIPNTEKMVDVKSHWLPRFTPGKKLKRQVKQ